MPPCARTICFDSLRWEQLQLRQDEEWLDFIVACRYQVPNYWTIGEVYERLIEDVSGDREESLVERLIEVYTSWIDDEISNYNSDYYYQSTTS